MIRGKEMFIAHVSDCLGRDKLPSAPAPFKLPHDVHHQYLKDADLEELKAVFRTNSEATGTTVYECALEDLNATLLTAINGFDKGKVLIADHLFFQEQGVIKAMQEEIADLYLWGTTKSREENMANAETAMVGITMAEMGLAETGTVILFSHRGSGRSVSLLPTYSITVLRAEDLRPRLTQGLAFLKKQKAPLPSSINFVSGASSTADIELVVVKGVHGPLKIAYVVVE
jgi:L-lactate dehydrogenase complex protein LldG